MFKQKFTNSATINSQSVQELWDTLLISCRCDYNKHKASIEIDLHDAEGVSTLENQERKHQGVLLYKDPCIVDR